MSSSDRRGEWLWAVVVVAVLVPLRESRAAWATEGATRVVSGESVVLRVGPLGGDVTALVAVGDDVIAGTGATGVVSSGGTIFRSDDQGRTWQLSNGGFPNRAVRDLLSVDRSIYAATSAGGYFSRDSGRSWIGPGQGMNQAHDLAARGSELYAVSPFEGVFKSTDRGRRWRSSGKGIDADRLGAIGAVGNDLYVGTDASGTTDDARIFKSTNGGNSWSEVFSGFPGSYVRVLTAHRGDIYVGMHQGGVLRSTDGGAIWTPINVGLPNDGVTVHSILSAGADLYVSLSGHRTHRSSDNGDSWQVLANSETSASVLAASSSYLFAGTPTGLTRSDDRGDSWKGGNQGLTATNILTLFRSSSDLFAGTAYGGAFRSRDQGATWTEVNNGHDGIQVRAFVESNDVLYMASWARGVYKSGDGGDSWSQINTGLTNTGTTALGAVGNTILLGTFRGVFTTGDGENWTERTQGMPSTRIESFMTLGTDVFAATPSGVFKSTDAGESWTAANDGLTSLFSEAGFVYQGDLLLSTNAGLFRSSDAAASWSQINRTRVQAFATDGLDLFVSDVSRVFRSTDGGVTLEEIDVGTPLPPSFQALATVGETLLVGTDSLGVLVTDSEPDSCVAKSSQLCLNQGRFAVTVRWSDFQGGGGSAQAVPFGSDDSGLLYFFDGENWEMLVKVLDACRRTDHFWVFAAATTNVEYTLTVTDTVARTSKVYFNPLGNAAPAITDNTAFPTCDAGEEQGSGSTYVRLDDLDAHPGIVVHDTSSPGRYTLSGAAADGCIPGSVQLCLSSQRFKVEVDWRNFKGETGSGMVVPFGSEDSGLFYFFHKDNWEMLVKVLDKCGGKSNHFWVFAAATTNVEYTLTVTDTLTSEVKEYFNPLGTASPAITDVSAFATCP